MLPAAHRLGDSNTFRLTTRRGSRGSSRTVVAHILHNDEADATRVGLVVSKKVGPAVVRNRVKRQLRHLLRERLTVLPAGTTAVIRALPGAAGRTSDVLRKDLDKALERAGVTSP